MSQLLEIAIKAAMQAGEKILSVYGDTDLGVENNIAAGHAIALFAGKSVVQLSTGTTLLYNKENMVTPFFIVE